MTRVFGNLESEIRLNAVIDKTKEAVVIFHNDTEKEVSSTLLTRESEFQRRETRADSRGRSRIRPEKYLEKGRNKRRDIYSFFTREEISRMLSNRTIRDLMLKY